RHTLSPLFPYTTLFRSMTYNFGAGPTMLPRSVVKRIQEEFPNWHGGMSAMEISHRSIPFKKIAERSEENLRKLLNIPDNYYVLLDRKSTRLNSSHVKIS